MPRCLKTLREIVIRNGCSVTCAISFATCGFPLYSATSLLTARHALRSRREIGVKHLVYKNIYTPLRMHSGMGCILSMSLIGARGFEPPTPWSRIRFWCVLKSVECGGFDLILAETFAGCLLKRIELD